MLLLVRSGAFLLVVIHFLPSWGLRKLRALLSPVPDCWSFQVGSVVKKKKSAWQCRRHRRWGFNPWVRKIPRGGNGSPLQYSFLDTSKDRGAWRVTVHGVTKCQTQLSTHTHTWLLKREKVGQTLLHRWRNSLPLSFHRLEFSHRNTPHCKKGWEM